jgi:hypothetical protein
MIHNNKNINLMALTLKIKNMAKKIYWICPCNLAITRARIFLGEGQMTKIITKLCFFLLISLFVLLLFFPKFLFLGGGGDHGPPRAGKTGPRGDPFTTRDPFRPNPDTTRLHKRVGALDTTHENSRVTRHDPRTRLI